MSGHAAYKSPEPEEVELAYIPAQQGGRATGQGTSTGRSSLQSTVEVREDLEENVTKWLERFNEVEDAEEMEAEYQEMATAKVTLDGVLAKAHSRLRAVQTRTMEITFSEMRGVHLNKLGVVKDCLVIPEEDFVKVLETSLDASTLLVEIEDFKTEELTENLKLAFTIQNFGTEAASRKLIDLFTRHACGLIESAGGAATSSPEFMLSALNNDPSKFEILNAQGIKEKTTVTGRVDELLAVAPLIHGSGHVSMEDIDGEFDTLDPDEAMMPLQQETVNEAFIEKWRYIRYIKPVQSYQGDESTDALLTVLEAKSRTFREEDLLWHLPQAIAESLVGHERTKRSNDGTLPFMLSDGFTWYFGILIKDPHDPSQLWTCCRSEAFNLTLDWVLEPLDPENQEASEFLDQVLLIVEAMLTWMCTGRSSLRSMVYKRMKHRLRNSRGAQGATEA